MNRVGVNRPGGSPSWNPGWAPAGPSPGQPIDGRTLGAGRGQLRGHPSSLDGDFTRLTSARGWPESVAVRSRSDQLDLEPIDDPAQRGRQEPTAGPVDEHTDGGGTGGNATTPQRPQ